MSVRHEKELLLTSSPESRFHGAPDVESVVGLTEGANFRKKKVLFVGDIPKRWDITKRLKRLGAKVTVVDTYTDGNPMKRVKPSSKELKGKMYDHTVLAMVGAFRTPIERIALIQANVESTDIERGGSFGMTALNFTNFEEHAAKGDVEINKHLADLNASFFETVNFNRYAGFTSAAEVRAAVGERSDFQVTETVNIRPEGTQYWPEIYDLLEFQESVIVDALKGVKMAPGFARPKELRGKSIAEFKRDLHAVNARIIATKERLRDILSIDEEKRPLSQPPAIHRVVVRKSDSTHQSVVTDSSVERELEVA
jgi:hypothetical protein